MAFPKSITRFYLQVARQHWFGVSAYFILRSFVKCTSYILPTFVVKYLVGALEKSDGDMNSVVPVVVGLGIWIVCYILCELGRFVVAKKCYPETKKSVHVKIYKYLIDKSVAFYKSHSAGYLAEQAKHIVNGTWKLMFYYPTHGFAVVIGVLLNFGVLFDLSWMYGTIILSVLGFRVVHASVHMKRLADSYVDVAQHASVVGGRNIDILSNFLNLKIFGNQKKEEQYVGDYFSDWVDSKTENLRQQLKFFGLPMSLEFLSLILIIVLLVRGYGMGTLDLAQVAFVITAFFSLRTCVTNVVWEIPTVLEYFSSAQQALKIITATPDKLCNVKTGKNICKYNSVIEFKNVSFKYDDEWVLQNINLCISKGERIGIVGASGSGKTTLVNLLMHLYDVTQGEIKIDGTDIRQFTAQSLKSAISFVPQESILFNRTLAENISYGITGVTRRQIIGAGRLAQAHDFIMKTENGYDTIVGDRGVKLSGGQRQRITIAHAILKNSPILLLDEATSALDSETESKIQQSLDVLMQDRTTIAIAHRLSTLKKMDRIIVMDRGRIVEMGTHAQLIRKRGRYYKMWKLQYSGFM